MGNRDTTGHEEDPQVGAIPARAQQAKAAGKDLRVRPPKARKTKVAKPGKIDKRARRIQAQEKRRLALEARKAGLTYAAIAERVGYASAGAAHKAVQVAFSRVIQEPAADLKVMQVERINHMLVALWPKAQAGDERSIGMVLALMDKLDRYEGVEAATRSEVHHTGSVLVAQGNKEDFINAMRQMAGIAPDGTNIQATQTGPAALSAGSPDSAQGSLSDSARGDNVQSSGVTYPPGMGLAHEIVQGEVISTPPEVTDEVISEELPPEPDIPVVNDVPKGKTYAFGVDPKPQHTTKGTK